MRLQRFLNPFALLPLSTAAGAALGLLQVPACTTICNLVGCSYGFTLTIANGEGDDEYLPLVSADYKVTVELEDSVWALECTPSEEDIIECGDVELVSGSDDTFVVEQDPWLPGQIGLRVVNYQGNDSHGPDRLDVHVEVQRDGETTEIGQSFEPDYETTYPNGEDCGACRTGYDAMLLGLEEPEPPAGDTDTDGDTDN